MRNMSFLLTTDQIKSRTKTVTRRLGWRDLQPGQLISACVKCQGLKRGETLERIGLILVTTVSTEPLSAITPEDVLREGFPELSPAEFIEMFCRSMNCRPDAEVRRIEFRYIAGPSFNGEPEAMGAMGTAAPSAGR